MSVNHWHWLCTRCLGSEECWEDSFFTPEGTGWEAWLEQLWACGGGWCLQWQLLPGPNGWAIGIWMPKQGSWLWCQKPSFGWLWTPVPAIFVFSKLQKEWHREGLATCVILAANPLKNVKHQLLLFVVFVFRHALISCTRPLPVSINSFFFSLSSFDMHHQHTTYPFLSVHVW